MYIAHISVQQNLRTLIFNKEIEPKVKYYSQRTGPNQCGKWLKLMFVCIYFFTNQPDLKH